MPCLLFICFLFVSCRKTRECDGCSGDWIICLSNHIDALYLLIFWNVLCINWNYISALFVLYLCICFLYTGQSMWWMQWWLGYWPVKSYCFVVFVCLLNCICVMFFCIFVYFFLFVFVYLLLVHRQEHVMDAVVTGLLACQIISMKEHKKATRPSKVFMGRRSLSYQTSLHHSHHCHQKCVRQNTLDYPLDQIPHHYS